MSPPGRRLLSLMVITGLGVALASAPAYAAPGRPWPSTAEVLAPVDPQNWENPDAMTWQDLRKVPDIDWSDPNRKGSVRTIKAALVLGDYPNEQFAITRARGSDIYGNPRSDLQLDPKQVANFYRDFLNKPQEINHGLTMHGYWMETSNGRIGVTLDAFGVYRMPGKKHEYGFNEWDQAAGSCPTGDRCNRSLRTDLGGAWRAEQGSDIDSKYDVIFYQTAGNDESSTWQEFGEMKFANCESIPAEFGGPDLTKPRCAKTRYVPWTTWQAAANHWPNASGKTTTQAESSGLGTFSHELSHVFGIADNYNNPYGTPQRRAGAGPWSMLDRGTFNGPGGPHTRFHIPATQGGAAGVQHTLRDKMKLNIVDEANILRLSREALASSGVVVMNVTARAIPMGPAGRTGLTGANITMNRDLSPTCNTSTDPLCDGGNYNNYTVEVVDRIGYDSFTPDSGVMLSKTKNADATPFVWVVDSHPEDIRTVDFVRPDGTKQYYTIGDYRQLSDALFHAGTNSGTKYEYVDTANRLHFYVLDVNRDAKGVLSYKLAVRSLDGQGPHTRGVSVSRGNPVGRVPAEVATCQFPLRNTGQVRPFSNGHPEDVSAYVDSDVYRLSASVSGNGWSVQLPSEIVTAKAGTTVNVPVNAVRAAGGMPHATVTLTAKSESSPTATSTATCQLSVINTMPPLH
ncbi:M6 family metalloprotease domain-containing protein [Kibdelosporangium aridum]|uniref:M6 family metalloprotease domain-containing protein n=2 Tax=Kibdelosporangium aridum TaxID=2030 RepID=A0A1W2FNK8_KIBAR|nr:M6 family metalloprotease domain-containing protein [Kibdelosporangium aridum]